MPILHGGDRSDPPQGPSEAWAQRRKVKPRYVRVEAIPCSREGLTGLGSVSGDRLAPLLSDEPVYGLTRHLGRDRVATLKLSVSSIVAGAL